MKRLQGVVAVITGGTSGFGFSTAELFAREGASVVIAARRKEKGVETHRKIKELTGVETTFISCDVSKETDVESLVRETLHTHKTIDVLVNNAGTVARTDFLEATEQEWYRIMDINLKGVFLCCKHVIPVMLESGKGSIVNVSSNIGLVGRGDVPIYAASKGGVTILTQSLALRYAKNNIRVNCVCPGLVITDLNRDVVEKASDPVQKMKDLESMHPMNRLGTTMDVAYAALYLASGESQWVTGIALPVDGGYVAG
jgi:NAD(P)-dependent dehydrogenase (short-subunit alcohol dehydrogenase family)